MTIRANIVANTSNASVILDSVSGIVREDVFVSNITLRAKNVRVLSIDAGNSIVYLTQNVSITTGNLVQFQKLVTGTGLIASDSQISYFMRDKPSYNPAIDPRLPRVTKLSANLVSTATSVAIQGNISTTGIYPIVIPHASTQNAYGANIEFQSTSDVQIGDYLLGGTLGLVSNVRVDWVGNGNTRIGFNKPAVASEGQVFLFRRPVQPAIRVGSETVYYSNAAVNLNNTITLTDLVRNIANTQPIDKTITTLAQPSAGAILDLADATGVKVLDYVLINNTTLSSNVRVLWIPEGTGNANVGISVGINADSGATVSFQRDWVWAANTTVSILGSIPL